MLYTLRAAATIAAISSVQSVITKRRHRRAVQKTKPPRRPTTCCGKLRCTCPGTAIDPRESGWWKLIHDDRVWDPESKQGKIFRQRFRVPFPVFQFILNKWTERGWAGIKETDCTGR